MSRERARGSAHATITETITFGALPGIIALTVLVGLLFGFAQARGGQERAGAAAWAQAELDYLRAQGYEGDPCSACGQLTLVRSGACAKCDTCGETSGCS